MAGSVDCGKVRQWQQRMARFDKARQSVAEFCRREGISAPSFYHWRKRLARGPRLAAEAADFRPVRLVASGEMSVRLPGGTQLRVPVSDAEALRVAIDALARADAQRAGGGRC